MGGPCTVDEQVHKELDNFHQCQIQWEGKIWPSSEHVYQAAKYPHNEQQREIIRLAASGMESWQSGQTLSEELRADWEEVKVDLMYQANLAKFGQNPMLRNVLVNSRGPIKAQGGIFWKTWNEILLERIREELRGDDKRDTSLLTQRMSFMDAYQSAAKAKDKHNLEVVTKYASKRVPVPDLCRDSLDSLVVVGADEDLDGVYRLDLLAPEANGCQHYSNRQGGHLCLGVKQGVHAWVLDVCYSPQEATGAAFIVVKGDTTLPLGQQTWQCFDGRRHVDRTVSLQIKAKTGECHA